MSEVDPVADSGNSEYSEPKADPGFPRVVLVVKSTANQIPVEVHSQDGYDHLVRIHGADKIKEL